MVSESILVHTHLLSFHIKIVDHNCVSEPILPHFFPTRSWSGRRTEAGHCAAAMVLCDDEERPVLRWHVGNWELELDTSEDRRADRVLLTPIQPRRSRSRASRGSRRSARAKGPVEVDLDKLEPYVRHWTTTSTTTDSEGRTQTETEHHYAIAVRVEPSIANMLQLPAELRGPETSQGWAELQVAGYWFAADHTYVEVGEGGVVGVVPLEVGMTR